MDLTIVNIGNSKGVRIPKAILDKYNIQGKVEMILEKGYIILKPKAEPRKNWEKAFKEMHENGDDKLLMDDFFNDETFEEWS
jgi:antitoxin MazE